MPTPLLRRLGVAAANGLLTGQILSDLAFVGTSKQRN